MILKQTSTLLRPIMALSLLYLGNLSLKSQTHNSGSMTPFYIVTIVFTVLVVAAVISFFIKNKRKN